MEAIIFIISLIIAKQYFDNYFVSGFNKTKTSLVYIGGYLLLFLVYYIKNPTINITCFLLVNILIARFAYRTTIKRVIVPVIMLTIVMDISEIIVLTTFTILFDWSKSYWINYDTSSGLMYLNVIISKTIYFGIVRLMIYIKQSKEYTANKNTYMYLSLVPLSSFLLMYSLFLASIENSFSVVLEILVLISCIVLLFGNFAVFYVYDLINKANYENTQLQLKRQKEDIDILHYKELEKNYAEARIITHNIKNNLVLIKTMAEGQNYEELQEFIKNIEGNITNGRYVKYADNKILDIIFNQKLRWAEENGIKINIQNEGVNLYYIEDLDLSSIFTNIIDNAIEASLLSNKKEINIKLYRNNSFDIATTINTCDNEPQVLDKTFITTKKDKKCHGFGILSVKKSIDKYQGTITFDYNKAEKIFTVMIKFMKL